ncbi:MAG: YceD family protein [Cyanobium sp.]
MSEAPLALVPLAELRLRAGGRRWAVEQPIAGLASLTPVRGSLRAEHHGNALEVEGRADTIVTLCCDRCLQHFNHPLRVDCRELLELAGAPTATLEADILVGDDLDDRLDPRGSFDPERWLFEQLSLQLPLVKRCGDDCLGPPAWAGGAAEAGDPRWAALTALRPDADQALPAAPPPPG